MIKNPVGGHNTALGVLQKGGFRDFGGTRTFAFSGDLNIARSHTGIAEAFVKTVADLMTYSDLNVMRLKKRLHDDTVVTVTINCGHAYVEIEAPISPGGKSKSLEKYNLLPEWSVIRKVFCTGGDRGFFQAGDATEWVGGYTLALLLPKHKLPFEEHLFQYAGVATSTTYPQGTPSLVNCAVSAPRLDWIQDLPNLDTAGDERHYKVSFPKTGFTSRYTIRDCFAALGPMPSRQTTGVLVRQGLMRDVPESPTGTEVYDGLYAYGLAFLHDTYEWSAGLTPGIYAMADQAYPGLIVNNDIHPIYRDVVSYRFGGDAQFPDPENLDIITGAWQITLPSSQVFAKRLLRTPSAHTAVMVSGTLADAVDNNNRATLKGRMEVFSLSKRMYAIITGTVSKGSLDHVDGDISYYKGYGSFHVSIMQVEDDGSLSTINYQFVTGETYSPADNAYCEAVYTGVNETTYLPCSYDVVCAPKNTLLFCKDRMSSMSTVAGDTGPSAMNCLGIITQLVTGSTWTLLAPAGISANVAIWAQDGSGFVSRKWPSSRFGPAGEIIGDMYMYDVANLPSDIPADLYSYDIVSFTGSNFQIVMTVRPATYPPTKWRNLGPYYIHHSDNLETLVIVGSLDTDGIYKRNINGTYTQLFAGFDGWEPIFISPDGRCVATKTHIFIDGVLAASPARCAGVFFDLGAFMDLDLGTELLPGPGLCIKAMATGDVLASVGAEYNFWELARDSSVAIVSKYYTDTAVEGADAPVMAYVVDFANGPYKFETSDLFTATFIPIYPDLGQINPLSSNGMFLDTTFYRECMPDGIPFGRRSGAIVYLGLDPTEEFGLLYAMAHVTADFAYNCFWYREREKEHGNTSYDTTETLNPYDLNTVTSPASHAGKVMLDWPTGFGSGSILCTPYSDNYNKRVYDSNYLDKRIYSHIHYSAAGIMERLTTNLGPVPDEARKVDYVKVEQKEV